MNMIENFKKDRDHFKYIVMKFLSKIWNKIYYKNIPVGFIPGYEDVSMLAYSSQSAIVTMG